MLSSAGAKLPSVIRVPLLLPVTCSMCTGLVSVGKTYRVVKFTAVLLQNHLIIRLLQYLCRRKGGNTNYKYIGKMFDGCPGCTWEIVVIVVMLNVKAESFDASAL